MHILIALLPSLLWGTMALLNAAFPTDLRRQNTFVIAGGGAASLLTSPLTGAAWSLRALAWGSLSGLLWSIGIVLVIKGFQTWGASRTMPLTTVLQLALNGLIGVVLLGEWRAPGAMGLGMSAIALVIVGGVAGAWQEGDGVGPSPRMRRTGALMTVCSAVFLGIYPGMLRLTDVSARRGRRTVLSGINLTIHRGEVVAVVGANGAGKSTLLQLCAGLLRASGGSVERTPNFGYAPQLDSLAPLLTVDEHLRLFGAARGIRQGRSISTGHRLLTRLGWTARGDQTAGTLSGGTQQKLNVALAQLDAPDLLLLDEPYQGLDALAYEDLWALISAWRTSGAGVLLVTHLLRDVDLVDRVVELPAPQEDASRAVLRMPRRVQRKESA